MISSMSHSLNISGGMPSGSGVLSSISLFVTARYSSVVKGSVLMSRSGKTAIISSSSPSVMTGPLHNRSLKWVYNSFSVSDLLFHFNTPFLVDFLPLISLTSFQHSACWCDEFAFSTF